MCPSFLTRGRYKWKSILEVEPHGTFFEEVFFRVGIVSSPIYDGGFMELSRVLHMKAEEISKIITRTS